MRVRTFVSSVVVFTMMQILAPADTSGQRLPASVQFVQAEIQLGSTGALQSGVGFGTPLTSVDPAGARSAYELLADTASAAWKRRMTPYVIGGAIVGGVVGYAVMPKGCDVGDNMFCQYQLWAYPVIASGVGMWAGLLVGYLRERSPPAQAGT